MAGADSPSARDVGATIAVDRMESVKEYQNR
jgi:hypothetical protein